MRRAVRVTAQAAIACAIASCGRSAELAEADRVLHAIDALRNSPADALDARTQLVTDLEKQEATLPESVAARDRCASAYRLLVRGKRLAERVKKGLADPRTVDPSVLSDLVDAEATIKASAEAMPACDTARADLGRRARN